MTYESSATVDVTQDYEVNRRISAVIGGLVVTLVVQLLLSLLGLAIGASTVDPLVENNPTQGIALGSGIWFVVSGMISLFAGGCVAAFLADTHEKTNGALLGTITWGIATILTFYLLTSAVGGLINGIGSVFVKGVSSISQGILDGSAKTPVAISGPIKEEITKIARTIADRPDAAASLGSSVTKLLSGDGETEANKEAVVEFLTTSGSNMSREDATEAIDRWQTSYNQTVQQAEIEAREVSDKAASGIAKAAGWTFIALLLGGISAAVGGMFASSERFARHHVPFKTHLKTT